MILIADSGSTKTDWRLIDDEKKIRPFQTQGISPFFQTEEDIIILLKTELISADNFPKEKNIEKIYFYGTGCKTEDKKQIVKNALTVCFPERFITIESDLLGAARALCGNENGIAAILGTGSNTCVYDGQKIIENRTSSGFILGDEGSGAHIGKTLVQAFLNDELPTELSKRFTERFKLSKDDIIDAVHRKPLPNRFLASFSKFVYQNLKEQYMVDLVSHCFNQFFEKHICKYKQHTNYKLNCVGSVAFYYSNILRAVALNKNVQIGTIVETPIAALALYHIENS